MIRGLCPTARMLLDCGAGRSVDRAVLIRAVRAGVDDVLDRDDMASVEQIVGSALRAAGRHRERVLAIGAHPDDVEIGCGGTLLDHRMRDDLVSVLTLSRGAAGGDRQRRLAEAAAAAEMLGARLFVGDLPDTAIDSGIETI
ncbi:MAG: PIG-L family deacetylase, partial [Actinobacteria bacterium]|nr:PIG-L family deacetylase [Actinomycetota bacterium]